MTDTAMALRTALTAPTDGIVGVADALLAAARAGRLLLEYADGECRVSGGPDGEAWAFAVPLRRSVVRAVLARIATLCGADVSPYGGRGTVRLPDSPTVIAVEFVNTSQTQAADLRDETFPPLTTLAPLSDAAREAFLAALDGPPPEPTDALRRAMAAAKVDG